MRLFILIYIKNTSLITLRFIQGIAAPAGIVISLAFVRYIYSGVELTKFLSLLTLIRNLAPLLDPIFREYCFTSWEGVFILLGIWGGIFNDHHKMGGKEILPVKQRVPSNFIELSINFKTLLQKSFFIGCALLQGIMTAGIFAYISGTPFIYQKIYDVSHQVFALNGISLILGTQLVRRLAGGDDRAVHSSGWDISSLFRQRRCSNCSYFSGIIICVSHSSSFLLHRLELLDLLPLH